MVEEKKVKKMLDTLERISDNDIAELERELPRGNRVALSNIRNTKHWMPLLEQFYTVEIISGSETVAQINSPDLVPSLLKEIRELKKEVEDLQLNALYSHRIQEMNPMSGDELAKASTSYLDEYLDTRGSTEND